MSEDEKADQLRAEVDSIRRIVAMLHQQIEEIGDTAKNLEKLIKDHE